MFKISILRTEYRFTWSLTDKELQKRKPYLFRYYLFRFLDMPFIIKASQGILIVNESQPIDLFCEFQSNPKAAAYWKGHSASLDMKIQNSSYLHTLHSSVQYFITRAKLYMARATPSDSGFYTCGANNSLGASERNITVIVKCE